MAIFQQHIMGLIEREGGYVNDPDDAGGETKYGISKRAYPGLDIPALTKQDAADIYRVDYWDQLLLDHVLGRRTAGVVFDFGVNAGVKRASRHLQIAAGATVDGIVGPKTLDAANALGDELLATRYTIQRVRYYLDLADSRKSQKKFLRGWLRRALLALTEG